MAEALGESPLQMQSVIIAHADGGPAHSRLRLAGGQIRHPPGLSGRHPAVYSGFLACAIANTLPLLVIARVLQGSGAPC
jgi:hypothetical protein